MILKHSKDIYKFEIFEKLVLAETNVTSATTNLLMRSLEGHVFRSQSSQDRKLNRLEAINIELGEHN